MRSQKRKSVLSVISVLILICTIISASYAFYVVSVSEKIDLATTVSIPKCASVNLASSTGIALSGDNSAPISDRKALSSTSYRYAFTVTNSCSETSTLVVSLAPDADQVNPISPSAIKYAIIEQGATVPTSGSNLYNGFNEKLLSAQTVAEVKKNANVNVQMGYEVLNVSLAANTTKNYYIYVWVDYNEGGLGNNSTMNKTFKSHLVISNYSPTLPSGYTQLAYIESNGTQYIDTGYVPNQNTKVEVETVFPIGGTQFLFGSRGSSSTSSNTFTFVNFNGTYRVDHHTSMTYIDAAANTSGKFKIVMDTTSAYVNGQTISYSNAAFTTPVNLWIFTGNESNTMKNPANAKIYYFRIWEGSEIVRDFVPAKNSSGTVGLYDRVTSTFYTNKGTGKFGAGYLSDSLPNGYTELAYIESTGSQFIDTGVYPSQDLKMSLDLQFTGTWDNTQNGGFYGAYGPKYCFSSNFGGGTTEYNRIYNWIDECYTGSQEIFAQTYTDSSIYSSRNIFEMQSGKLTYGGVTTTVATKTSNSDGVTIALFGNNKNGLITPFGGYNMRLYGAKFYKGSELVRNFIPAKNSKGEAGLYDMVGGKFYTGGGAFVYEDELPSGYTRVEYLQSSGTQYINTGLAGMTDDTEIEASAMFMAEYNYNMLFGQWGWLAFSLKSGNTFAVALGRVDTQAIPGITGQLNKLYNIKMKPGYGITIDGVKYTFGGGANGVNSYPFFLFGASAPGTTNNTPHSWSGYGQVRIYSFKIWQNGNVVRLFVPCLNASGTPGLYDLVGKQFYANAGSGTFTYA